MDILHSPLEPSQDAVLAIHERLESLRNRIDEDRLPLGTGLTELSGNPVAWSRDGVAIASDANDILASGDAVAAANVLIITPHAEVAGWMMDEVLRAFGDLAPQDLTHRLGEALYWFQEDYPDDDSAHGLLAAIVREAAAAVRAMANEQLLGA